MNALRTAASALLDKVDALLKGEPVRLITYSAAAVIYATVWVLNAMGITRFGEGLSFEAALTLSFAAVGVLVLIVERVRMFVYAPQTYIEDLADESLAAHQAAHFEEQMTRAIEEAAAQATAGRKTRVPVGTAKAAGTKDQTN